LIEKKTKMKKGRITHNVFFGTSSMKGHVEFEHFGFLIAYVEEVVVAYNISGLQIVGYEGYKAI
jgi:hypothetical protein